MHEKNEKVEEIIKHYGVLGMKWGVRRDRKTLKKARAARQNGNKSNIVKETIGSIKREQQWKKVLKNVDNMSTKDISKAANRMRMESDLKRLSNKRDVGSSKDRKDYRTRAKMSDQELSRKVTRLKAKDSLSTAVTESSKAQKEFGKKLTTAATTLGVQYALTKSITPKDLMDAWNADPKKAAGKATQQILNEVVKRKTGTDALKEYGS